ncbi:MAG TPA: 2-C-methyl-D-erythritol 2,4-cyclodiphosphate synthase [Gemmatimonadales bacterium]|jgi:2-C-methyl-D-erythritol 2,4-cyclodiphosphate synthase|nr:2-C-methyl-D-erythritol 2,4-cyclodiphosphate synthase [Gemmatimonadales bacterium]
MRVGIGYDSHRFVDGRPLVLGGQRIPHAQGLAGHSDADAVAHAVTDALLGAVAAGSIGDFFPDSDPQWRDADSMALLRQVVTLVIERGFAPSQADITVICEAPRLSSHAASIAGAIADVLGIQAGGVGFKAKSNEGMGFIGRGEGLAVMAVVTVEAR